MDELYTVNSRSFDRKIKRSWQCELLEQSAQCFLLKGVFEQDVLHPALGRIAAGTVSYEYFWTDRWYNVFRFHEPEGTFRNYYCNVACPTEIAGRTIDYIDLDIDVIVDRTWRVSVVDELEFLENSRRYGYTPDVIREARSSVQALLSLIAGREFPFDFVPILPQTRDASVLPSIDPNN